MSLQQNFVEALRKDLVNDDKVKVAGLDADGLLRGKIISKKRFFSVIESGFGFCSVLFGWDMHDRIYFKDLPVSKADNSYQDLVAKVDIQSFRRIPWETCEGSTRGVPLFLVSFLDPNTLEPVVPCPRGVLKKMVQKLDAKSWEAMAGIEYEFYNYRQTPQSLATRRGMEMEHLTPGNFAYSLTRPLLNKDFYYDIFTSCEKFKVNLEGWHTESGPGVYEAALAYSEISEMADRASLFKYLVKALGASYEIMPCFMAKPVEGLPGNSGHVHISLVTADGTNLFARSEKNPNPTYPDLAYVSEIGEMFLAGIIDGLPSIMPILAPTINSYKRLVENFWAAVTVSWGFEHRYSSVRVISPPVVPSEATRFEIRTPGADANPHYVLAAILGCGIRGIEEKLKLKIPPMGKEESSSEGQLRLAQNLKEAVEKMTEKDSVARKVFGDGFVDHFAGTRTHELRLFAQAVTDWEVKRYIEMV